MSRLLAFISGMVTAIAVTSGSVSSIVGSVVSIFFCLLAWEEEEKKEKSE